MNKTSAPILTQAHTLLQNARAVIFDFDGVLVDTEYAIYTSWLRVFQQYGQPLPLNQFNQCLGSGYTHWNPGEYLEQLTGKQFDWQTINAARQKEIVRDLKHAGLMPGAKELIQTLADRRVLMAVASSSSHQWVDGWLRRLNIMPYFAAVVCKDEGFAVKPAPDLFLQAAARLQVPPSQCVAIEDSQNGTVAAHKANMPVIAIPNRITQTANFSAATCRICSLMELL